MKWKALLALFILLLPVLVPATRSFLAEQEIEMVLIDEEKGQENSKGKSFNPVEEHLIPIGDYGFFFDLPTRHPAGRSALPRPPGDRLTPPPDMI